MKNNERAIELKFEKETKGKLFFSEEEGVFILDGWNMPSNFVKIWFGEDVDGSYGLSSLAPDQDHFDIIWHSDADDASNLYDFVMEKDKVREEKLYVYSKTPHSNTRIYKKGHKFTKSEFDLLAQCIEKAWQNLCQAVYQQRVKKQVEEIRKIISLNKEYEDKRTYSYMNVPEVLSWGMWSSGFRAIDGKLFYFDGTINVTCRLLDWNSEEVQKKVKRIIFEEREAQSERLKKEILGSYFLDCFCKRPIANKVRERH